MTFSTRIAHYVHVFGLDKISYVMVCRVQQVIHKHGAMTVSCRRLRQRAPAQVPATANQCRVVVTNY